jgi:AcrR family transcriptional regulator
MVRNRFERLDTGKQERLFEAAAGEFVDRGYEAASVNRIIDAAGMSKGSLYYYFEDKADLFGTLLDRAVTRMLSVVGGFRVESLTAETYWPTMEAFVERSERYLSGEGWSSVLLRSFYRLHGGPKGRVLESLRRVTAEVLRRGQEVGVVRADLPLSYLAEVTLALGETGDRWLLAHWDAISGEERVRLVGVQMEMLRRILRVETEAGT